MLIEEIAGLTGSAEYAGQTWPTKMDTVLYVTASDIDADLSQYDQTLTAGGGGAWAAGSGLGLTDEFEISFQVECTPTTSGAIATSRPNPLNYYVGQRPGRGFHFYDEHLSAIDFIPHSDVGITGSALVRGHVSRRVNYQSGGLGDAIITELRIHNVTNDQYGFATLYHSASTGAASDMYIGCNTDQVAYTGDLHWIRKGSRFHSMPEARSDWDGLPENPASFFQDTQRRPLVMDRASGLGNEGQFYGPAILEAGSFARANNDATNSPLVNWVAGDWAELRNFSVYTTGSLCFQVPQLPNYEIYIPDLSWVTLPPSMVDWAHMRAFVSHGNASALNIRFVSMNRIPKVGGFQQGGLEPLEVYYSDVFSVGETHGQWATGSVRLARNSSEEVGLRNTTILGIAILAGQNSGNVGTIHALQALAGRRSGSLGSPWAGGHGEEAG